MTPIFLFQIYTCYDIQFYVNMSAVILCYVHSLVVPSTIANHDPTTAHKHLISIILSTPNRNLNVLKNKGCLSGY